MAARVQYVAFALNESSWRCSALDDEAVLEDAWAALLSLSAAMTTSASSTGALPIARLPAGSGWRRGREAARLAGGRGGQRWPPPRRRPQTWRYRVAPPTRRAARRGSAAGGPRVWQGANLAIDTTLHSDRLQLTWQREIGWGPVTTRWCCAINELLVEPIRVLTINSRRGRPSRGAVSRKPVMRKLVEETRKHQHSQTTVWYVPLCVWLVFFLLFLLFSACKIWNEILYIYSRVVHITSHDTSRSVPLCH